MLRRFLSGAFVLSVAVTTTTSAILGQDSAPVRIGQERSPVLRGADTAKSPSFGHTSEWNDMLLAIMEGNMGGDAGWFKPSESRYDGRWVQETLDPAKRGGVGFQGSGIPLEWFIRLDRDGDGVLTAVDFDWSDKGPLAQKTTQARLFMMHADRDRNLKLSQEEWNAAFERFARGEKEVDLETVRRLLFPPLPARPKGAPPDMPSTATLLQSLWNGELGSPFAGPRIGDFAPNFTLPTYEGTDKVTLKSFRGQKPVALIFGSFT